MDWKKKRGIERRDGCRAGWVWKGLGGLASDALIIDQLGGKKNMRTETPVGEGGGGENLLAFF